MTETPPSSGPLNRAKPIVVKRRGTSVVKVPLPLEQRWTVSIPGQHVHAFAGDTASNSLVVGDGWGVPYSALRLHRFDAATGAETASIRTRHQPVNALLPLDGRLLAATDLRLFEVTLPDLRVTNVWERGLVRYAQQLAGNGECVVQANWLRPSIGVLDKATGAVRRVKAGAQPLLFDYQGQVRVVSALEGGMATLDVVAGRLVDRVPVPPVAAIAAGRDIWAIVAGPPQTSQVSPTAAPVDLPQFRRCTGEVVRLTGDPVSCTLGGPCRKLWCDDDQGLLWCFLEGRPGDGVPTRVCAVRQATGEVVAHYETETAQTYMERDPQLGVVPIELAYLDVGLGILADDFNTRVRGDGATLLCLIRRR